MSHNSVEVADEKTDFPPNVGDLPTPKEGDLTPEMKDALIARAKEIIAGRIRPSAMVVPPEVEKFLQREIAGFDPPPTPKAIRHITEQLCLQAIYRGEPVACFTTADGMLTVLASGENEIWTLLQELSEDERVKVVITDTM
jgi:hypothetical protein